jgi:hypothetical protein
VRLVRALYLALRQTIIFGRGFAWVLHVRRALLLEHYTMKASILSSGVGAWGEWWSCIFSGEREAGWSG